MREAISSYCVEATDVASVAEFANERIRLNLYKDKVDFLVDEYQKYSSRLSKLDKLFYKVTLYLNSEDENHNKIGDIMENLDLRLKDALQGINRQEIHDMVNEITKLSKLMFKKEWKKSKRLFKL